MSIMQLTAKGVQDAFLESDQVYEDSMFTSRYKQHTPYASEHKNMVFTGTADFGRRCVITLQRLGDMMHKCTLFAKLKKAGSGEDAWMPMEQLCDSVQLWIGGQLIDHHPAVWFRLFDELYRDADEREAYKLMSNFHPEDPPGSTKTLYLPLLFDFCKDISRSLPLISLSSHDVELVFHMAKSIPGIDMTYPPTIGVTVEYIFLDVLERQMLNESKHREYLIETLQMHEQEVSIGNKVETHRVDLGFNHPCSSLIFCARGKNHGVFTGSGKPLEASEGFAPIAAARMVATGQERAVPRSGAWFRLVDSFIKRRRLPSAGVYVWDFALDPPNPSGSINMSKLDNVCMYITTKRAVEGAPIDTAFENENDAVDSIKNLYKINVFAPCWNWLVIKEGMAALKYSS